jgi:hypothetical protein
MPAGFPQLAVQAPVVHEGSCVLPARAGAQENPQGAEKNDGGGGLQDPGERGGQTDREGFGVPFSGGGQENRQVAESRDQDFRGRLVPFFSVFFSRGSARERTGGRDRPTGRNRRKDPRERPAPYGQRRGTVPDGLQASQGFRAQSRLGTARSGFARGLSRRLDVRGDSRRERRDAMSSGDTMPEKAA